MLISVGAVVMWKLFEKGFKPDFEVIADLSPWAISFFAATLIAATVREIYAHAKKAMSVPEFQRILEGNVGVFAAQVSVSILLLFYISFMVIKRHDSMFNPDAGVWVASFLLWFLAVLSCYWGYAKTVRA